MNAEYPGVNQSVFFFLTFSEEVTWFMRVIRIGGYKRDTDESRQAGR